MRVSLTGVARLVLGLVIEAYRLQHVYQHRAVANDFVSTSYLPAGYAWGGDLPFREKCKH
jgi:hypothetical protein